MSAKLWSFSTNDTNQYLQFALKNGSVQTKKLPKNFSRLGTLTEEARGKLVSFDDEKWQVVNLWKAKNSQSVWGKKVGEPKLESQFSKKYHGPPPPKKKKLPEFFAYRGNGHRH